MNNALVSYALTGLAGFSTSAGYVKGGKLRALAVTSRERSQVLPEVPTLQEVLGSELAVQESWFGLWAPARTPPAVVERLHAAVRQAAAQPALRASFEAVGNEAFADFVRSENRKWAAIIELAGITANS